MFLTKTNFYETWATQATQRATLRIKLHIPLIKLIKKDQVCYSAGPSTTNQNATQRIYIMDIKWLGNPYRHTVLKCNMKLYLKVIGMFMLYLPSSNCSYCSKCPVEGGSWYSSNCSTSTHDPNAKTKSSTYTYMQTRQKLRNSTTIHKNSKQNWSRTILRITTIAWTKRTPKTELEREN